MKKLYLILLGSTLSITTMAQQSFTTSGTFTVPAGITSVTVEVIGAGGKGGNNGAGGGGGGGYASGVYTVTPGATHAVVVGQASSGNGTSSVTSLGISATKGGNGISLTNPQIVGGGGIGGLGSGGQINRSGGIGGGGYYTYFGGGGGGAAGSIGNGGNGGDTPAWTGVCQTPGGLGGVSGGLPGGAGGKGAGFTDVNCNVPNPSAPGENYGAGGGGANGNAGPASLGANGLVKFTFCTPIGAPTGAAAQTLCTSATVADLVAQGTNIQWYSTATGGTALASTVVLTNNTTYYAEQISEPCETIVRLPVLVTIVAPIGAPTGNAVQTFCGGGTVADLAAQGTGIQWYAAATGGTALAGTVVLTNNTIYYAQQNSQPCETIVRLPVTAKVVISDLSTSVSGTTITATQTGVSYSWWNCATEQHIQGATSQSFTPTANGSYAVIIVNGTCSDTSACVVISTVGVSEVDNNSNIKIYPNPATELLTIQVADLLNGETFTIVDQNGRIVKSGKLIVGETNINIKDLMNGLYILKIGEKESQNFKVIKK